jgi:hypothetical protein
MSFDLLQLTSTGAPVKRWPIAKGSKLTVGRTASDVILQGRDISLYFVRFYLLPISSIFVCF